LPSDATIVSGDMFLLSDAEWSVEIGRTKEQHRWLVLSLSYHEIKSSYSPYLKWLQPSQRLNHGTIKYWGTTVSYVDATEISTSYAGAYLPMTVHIIGAKLST